VIPDLAWLPARGAVVREIAPGHRPAALLKRALARGRSIHVLLIEDDATIAEMYRVQLEYDGYRVTVASTGEAGIGLMADASPDLVLLDVLLPDRSGLEVMGQIKETFPSHPPIVILSNYGEPTMIERGLSLGAIEYLVKSRITPDAVSRSIPRWIDRNRAGDPPQRN
jgi:DNA-binding response OmpR family regulator